MSHSGWGQRWMESVAAFTPTKTLENGIRIAKSGQVRSIHIEEGFAEVDVQGSRTRPYKVEIGLPMFTRKQWHRVADAFLKKAFLTAKLLAGEMPLEMEQIFQASEAPLIPTDEDDISTDCSCLDEEIPCKHVTAGIYALGQEIDRNPFLLMEMRGLGRAQLLAEIQTLRNTGGKSAGTTTVAPPALTRPTHTPLSNNLNDFFQAPKDHPLTWPIVTDPTTILKPGGRIHEMGQPPFWQSDNDFEDVLTKIYQAVRKRVLE